MLSIVIGLTAMGLSLWGLSCWWGDFLVVMRGLLPFCFLMGGLVAVVAGASTFGGKSSAEEPPAEKK
jgi:hypothetical protein